MASVVLLATVGTKRVVRDRVVDRGVRVVPVDAGGITGALAARAFPGSQVGPPEASVSTAAQLRALACSLDDFV